MYVAGGFFLERAECEPTLNVPLEEDGYPFSARADIDQSMFWFKRAAEAGHLIASYKYGYYLVKSSDVDEVRLQEGEKYIAYAAQGKYVDALAYVGNASLNGSQIFPKNEEYAREVFEEAARQGHPMALAQLGAMLARGVGGISDKVTAARYTLDAANAGIPLAQFNMFALYMKGDGVLKNEAEGIRFLEEAAEQGHPKAIYNLAVYIADRRVPGRAVAEAEREYERAMQFDEYRARSSLYAAELIERRTNEISELVKAAKYLQTCYSIISEEDPYQLKVECLESCQKVVKRIRAHINANGFSPSLAPDDIFTAALFDRECIPVIDRDARIRYLMSGLKAASSLSDKAANAAFLVREACLAPRSSSPNNGRMSALGIHRRSGPTMDRGATLALPAATNVGRNEPCPCGTGLKFKRCHGK